MDKEVTKLTNKSSKIESSVSKDLIIFNVMLQSASRACEALETETISFCENVTYVTLHQGSYLKMRITWYGDQLILRPKYIVCGFIL